MSLIENVMRISKEKNIPIAQLEKDAGLAENSIYKWKSISPSVEKVIKVARVLGVRVDELVGWPGRK